MDPWQLSSLEGSIRSLKNQISSDTGGLAQAQNTIQRCNATISSLNVRVRFLEAENARLTAANQAAAVLVVQEKNARALLRSEFEKKASEWKRIVDLGRMREAGFRAMIQAAAEALSGQALMAARGVFQKGSRKGTPKAEFQLVFEKAHDAQGEILGYFDACLLRDD